MKTTFKKLSLKVTTCVCTIAAGVILFAHTSFAATLLNIGSQGADVSNLQQSLKNQGYYSYNVTGYYGSITQDAVIRFQQANGLSVDGIAGPQTLGKLYANQNGSSGTAHTNTSTILKIGNSGGQVSQLQQALQNKGYFGGSITGYFGTVTQNAVIAFQRDNGLTVDGIAGPQTLSTLYGSGTTTAVKAASTQNGQMSEDIYWLARIIEAEAGGESYQGKVAVGNVVMNRVNSPLFPNTVKSVVFEYYDGIPMFSPVADGTIYNTPSQSSIDAAYAAYNGQKPVGNATYFFNPSKASGSWIVKNKTYITTIGGHAFYG